MKPFAVLLVVVLSLSFFNACSHGHKESANEAAAVREVPGPIEQFTGQIVKTDEGYRFKPETEPENLQRLTRAKGGTDLAGQEIGLRKYFGKTLVVKGDSRNGWLLRATVIGQWLKPGETRGSTLLGPEPVPAKPR